MSYQVFVPVCKDGKPIILGEGLFGKVLLVEDQYGKQFAYKKSTRPEYLYNMLKEAKIMMKLEQHSNIMELTTYIPCTIRYEKGVDIVMPRCDGSLLNLIKESYTKNGFGLKEEILFDLVNDVANGITFMQSKNISHCNLKSENILYVTDTNQKSGYRFIIADFRASEDSSVRYVERPNYDCPEKFLKSNVNKTGILTCDVYSLGHIIYEAITGTSLLNFNIKEKLTDVQKEEKQIVKTLQLVGYDFISKLQQEFDMTRFMITVSKDGEIRSNQVLLSAFKNLGYTQQQKWIEFIENIFIPFPSQRKIRLYSYPYPNSIPNPILEEKNTEEEEEEYVVNHLTV
jgi:serine/threonine protein kinase